MDFIKTTLAQVCEFHTVFGHDIDVAIYPELRRLRIELIQEERLELETALREDDHAAIIDALADLAYVIAGTVVALDGTKQSVPYEDVQGIAIGMMMRDINSTLAEDLIQLCETIREYELMLDDDHAAVINALCAFGCVLLAQMHILCGVVDVDLTAAVAEAHRSNMTKLWSDDVSLRETQIAADMPRFSDIAFKVRPDMGEGLIGYRLTDGKILKCPSYSDANFNQFITPAFVDALNA